MGKPITTGPLVGMTQARWDGLSPAEREQLRDTSELSPQLIGLEGHRVEVREAEGKPPYRFIVGRSTGWRPIHLEVKTTRSRGGQPALRHYASIMDHGKVR